ncbi:hypothetical protein ACIGEP_09235 [Microbacterium sp. NPDC077663]|uniref:hypothetical protein n=1 Tax=Microbacterium sp. NPDC077663 TaxID=3364189 RepID=UPI0037C69C36
MIALPERVRHEGVEWTVSRAWPAAEGPVPVELRAADRVRGAWWSGGRLAVPPAGDDPALPGLRGLAGDLVSHRPGKRAVVRTPDGAAYLKVVRPKKAAAVIAASDHAAAFGAAFALPELDRDGEAEARGVVRFSALPGTTLHAWVADPAGDPHAPWTAWHESWVALAGTDAAGAAVHDAAAEAGVVADWAAHATRALPVAGDAIRRRVDAVQEGLLGHPSSRHVLAHRDLHDKQLLWDGERLGLLDVDTVSAAEPELDLANLREHVDLRVAQGMWAPARADVARTWIDRTAAAIGADPERTAAYAAATRLRLACLYLFRPRWRGWAERALLE